jgi:hypothetical protein
MQWAQGARPQGWSAGDAQRRAHGERSGAGMRSLKPAGVGARTGTGTRPGRAPSPRPKGAAAGTGAEPCRAQGDTAPAPGPRRGWVGGGGGGARSEGRLGGEGAGGRRVLPGRRAEEREERATVGRRSGRRRLPKACPPLPETPGRAANRKLESARARRPPDPSAGSGAPPGPRRSTDSDATQNPRASHLLSPAGLQLRSPRIGVCRTSSPHRDFFQIRILGGLDPSHR